MKPELGLWRGRTEDDAERTAWVWDVRLYPGYDPSDPRPPTLRALELAQRAAAEHGTVGLELSLGTQAADRVAGGEHDQEGKQERRRAKRRS